MMRDYILESIFLDQSLWKEVIDGGVEKHINRDVLENFCDPNFRADFCISIGTGEYEISPPYTGYQKKDDGGERVFFINEPQDRLLLSAIYKWLMKNESRLIHPSCKSYQSGIGIGKVVKEISARVSSFSGNESGRIIGRKLDIHKYFDAVCRELIHHAFDIVEKNHGASSIIDLLRQYYDSDLYYDSRLGELVEKYAGIKQGSAVSAWLANVLLYDIDEEISARGGLYVRYSDDIIYIGDDYEEVTQLLIERLKNKGLVLNEAKTTDIRAGEYFRFLGFEIHGPDITISRKWVKNFQREIDRRTVRNVNLIKRVRTIRKRAGDRMEPDLKAVVDKTMRNINRYLLYGNGRFSWATEVLPTINNEGDIKTLSLYCLDAVRAVYTGKTGIGGLGKNLTTGICRGTGRNVTSNRLATRHLEKECDGFRILEGYLSLAAVQKIVSNRWLLRTVAVDLTTPKKYQLYGDKPDNNSAAVSVADTIACMEQLYSEYLYSQPDGDSPERFYALSIDEMSMEELLVGGNRSEKLTELNNYLSSAVNFSSLNDNEESWYWQSEAIPQLVLLRQWFY